MLASIIEMLASIQRIDLKYQGVKNFTLVARPTRE